MKLTIEPLTEDRMADFIDFFDNRAFSDGSDYAPCYCNCFQMKSSEEKYVMGERAEQLGGGAEGLAAALRESAEEMIRRGELQGYLACADGAVVGWCNANDRQSYRRAGADEDYDISYGKRGMVKSVVCFAVAPGYRGSGIAKALLERVSRDAKAEGYRCMEVYPEAEEGYTDRRFCGPAEMYRNLGYEEIDRTASTIVMRKNL